VQYFIKGHDIPLLFQVKADITAASGLVCSAQWTQCLWLSHSLERKVVVALPIELPPQVFAWWREWSWDARQRSRVGRHKEKSHSDRKWLIM
jgi:hypothetical protein